MGLADYMNVVLQLGEGMLASLFIFVLTIVFSMPLGLVVAFGRMSKWAPFRFLEHSEAEEIEREQSSTGLKSLTNKVRRWVAGFKPLQLIAKVYISLLRGTPLMLQLLVVYFGPYYIFGMTLSKEYRLIAVLVGFSVNYAAYFAEIYRSGIQSIPVGQYEAASVLGYNKYQTFLRIIFPQMAKCIVPPVTNEVITLVKDTSLAFVLNYTEMFTLAKQIAAAKTTIMPLFVAGVFYFLFNAIVAFVMERVEKGLDYYR